MQMTTPMSLKLDLIDYLLRSMDHNCKVTTTLSNLCGILCIPLRKLDWLLQTLRDEGVIAFTRLGVYEEQEMQYLFALKPTPQTNSMIGLYQNRDKSCSGKGAENEV